MYRSALQNLAKEKDRKNLRFVAISALHGVFAENAFVDVLLGLVEDSALLQGGHVKQPFKDKERR